MAALSNDLVVAWRGESESGFPRSRCADECRKAEKVEAKWVGWGCARKKETF